MGSQLPKKEYKSPKKEHKSPKKNKCCLNFSKFSKNIYKWAPHPHTKTLLMLEQNKLNKLKRNEK